MHDVYLPPKKECKVIRQPTSKKEEVPNCVVFLKADFVSSLR